MIVNQDCETEVIIEDKEDYDNDQDLASVSSPAPSASSSDKTQLDDQNLPTGKTQGQIKSKSDESLLETVSPSSCPVLGKRQRQTISIE